MSELDSQANQMLFQFGNMIDDIELFDLVKNFLKVWIARVAR